MADHILELEDVSVAIDGRKVVDGISMHVARGESYVLFGPNGAGKTSLMLALAGLPEYAVEGRVLLNGKDLAGTDIDERATLGMAVGFQHPPEVTGVKLRDLLKICTGKKPDEDLSDEELAAVDKFQLTPFLDRDINVGFSGGERKRADVLQLLLMKPRLLLLDEPDSGVDLESLALIGAEIQNYLKQTGASAFIITHQGHILDHIEARHACVLVDGKIHCFKSPRRILEEIETAGYRHCITCEVGRKERER